MHLWIHFAVDFNSPSSEESWWWWFFVVVLFYLLLPPDQPCLCGRVHWTHDRRLHHLRHLRRHPQVSWMKYIFCQGLFVMFCFVGWGRAMTASTGWPRRTASLTRSSESVEQFSWSLKYINSMTHGSIALISGLLSSTVQIPSGKIKSPLLGRWLRKTPFHSFWGCFLWYHRSYFGWWN